MSLMLFFISSCSVSSHTRTDDNKPIIVGGNKHDTTTKEEEKKETSETKKTDTKTNPAEKNKWEKKDSYNIAYVLPFSMDASELTTLLGDDKLTSYQPLASIEFYEGALLALDTLKSYGVNLNIFTFDNKKDSASTAAEFENSEMKNMDLIIGPLFNECLKAAAPFAKANEVSVVSPLSPSGNVTLDNKYFIMANTTLQTQLRKTLDYVFAKNKNATIIIAYRKDKEQEVKIAQEFITAYHAARPEGSDASLKETSTISDISSELSTNENYVFIASTEELYVNGLIRDLSKASRADDITLLGLQGLLNIESISLDYFESLQFHYPVAYWINPNSPRFEAFEKIFTEKYSVKPSDYACRGYDITLYFGYLLYYYGPDIASNITKYNAALKSMLYQFNFQPSISPDNQFRFYENTNVAILKYNNYRFEKVN